MMRVETRTRAQKEHFDRCGLVASWTSTIPPRMRGGIVYVHTGHTTRRGDLDRVREFACANEWAGNLVQMKTKRRPVALPVVIGAFGAGQCVDETDEP